ncbi:MAG: arylesterase [Deltaproteobacteria bacterium]|jgi:acyl-CoA thioesterase-1|nr:arylesterase [Deltaproteobacteria bacterium]MBW2477410.1 arylesterase [Deltaproteobacteria bacterium]MBW2519404.1 arylesterase [Deltaproteobacteria bacterium]
MSYTNLLRRGCLSWLITWMAASTAFAMPPIRVLALGDSLTAGYGLNSNASFPAQLEARLKEQGLVVEVFNAGVSGDTSAGALARLEWSLADNPDVVILAIGANDALRGLDPSQTRSNLQKMLGLLQDSESQVVFAGMRAPRNLGQTYYTNFDRIYPELAQQYNVHFYPFFLEGVATEPALNLPDGIHPNETGISRIVDGILPLVIEAIQQAL